MGTGENPPLNGEYELYSGCSNDVLRTTGEWGSAIDEEGGRRSIKNGWSYNQSGIKKKWKLEKKEKVADRNLKQKREISKNK